MNITLTHTIKANENAKVLHMIILHDGRIASCSSDKTIKIFSLLTYLCEITIPAHDDEIWYIAELPSYNIVSCSDDSSIKVWSITKNNYTLVHSIPNAHVGYITQILPISENRMVSCGHDETIKIWSSVPPFALVKLLKEKNESESRQNTLYELKDKNLLLTCSVFGNGLTVYNLKTYCKETVIKAKAFDRNSIVKYEHYILLGGYSTLTIIDSETYKIYKEKDCWKYGDVFCFLPTTKSLVIFAAGEGKLLLLNLNEDSSLNYKEKEAHDDAINCLLRINDDEFASCSNDGTIKFWKGIASLKTDHELFLEEEERNKDNIFLIDGFFN